MTAPDFQIAIRIHMNRRVQRLHGGMGEIRKLIGRFQYLRGRGKGRFRLAIRPGNRRRFLGGQIMIFSHDLRRPARLRLAIVPLHGDKVAPLQGRPHIGRHHRNTAIDGHHIGDAFQRLGFIRIETGNRRAEFRRVDHHSGQHAGQLHINGEILLAFGLADPVETLQFRIANLRPFGPVFQRDRIRDRQI